MANLPCIAAVKQNIHTVLGLSSHHLRSIGQYYDCSQANPQFKYLYQQISGGKNMGICVPTVCSEQFVKTQLKNLLVQAGLNVRLLTTITQKDFYHRQFDWVFYVTAILSLCLIVLFLLATFKENTKPIEMFGFNYIKKNFQRNEKSNLNVFNGIKAITMIWIVFRHTYTLGNTQKINKTPNLNDGVQMLIDGALLGVDIFFFFGGFLFSYAAIKKIQDWKSFFKNILHRVLRIWPVFLYSILFYYSFYLHFGRGPYWGKDSEMVQQCAKIFKPLLFIDNYWQNGTEMCMGWTWYLNSDMQLFVLSLIVALIYKRFQIVAKVILWLLIIFAIFYQFFWYQQYGDQRIIVSPGKSFTKYFIFQYIKPYSRFPSYFFGVFIGILYIEYTNDKKKQSLESANLNDNETINQNKPYSFIALEKSFKSDKSFRLKFQIIGILIMMVVIVVSRLLLNLLVNSLYQSLSKSIFLLGLFLTILPSILGCKKSFVSFIVDTNLLNFIGKISFSTYVIHYMIIDAYFRGTNYDSYYTGNTKFVQFSALLIISLFFGMLITVLVQIPFGKIQTMILASEKVQKTVPEQSMAKKPTQVANLQLNVKAHLHQ